MSIPLATLPFETENDVIKQINRRLRMVRHAALAFFASAWADWNDEYGDLNPSEKDIMDIMPDEIDPAALKAAHELLEAVEKHHGAEITDLLRDAQNAADPTGWGTTPCDEEHFSHYLAMSAMGHGVGLDSVGLPHDWCHIPNIEFTPHDLDPANYPMPGD
jgi:hypothetical protein